MTRVNVISFTPIISKAARRRYSRYSQLLYSTTCRPNLNIELQNVETAERNVCMALAASISTNSQLLNTFARTKKKTDRASKGKAVPLQAWTGPEGS